MFSTPSQSMFLHTVLYFLDMCATICYSRTNLEYIQGNIFCVYLAVISFKLKDLNDKK